MAKRNLIEVIGGKLPEDGSEPTKWQRIMTWMRGEDIPGEEVPMSRAGRFSKAVSKAQARPGEWFGKVYKGIAYGLFERSLIKWISKGIPEEAGIYDEKDVRWRDMIFIGVMRTHPNTKRLWKKAQESGTRRVRELFASFARNVSVETVQEMLKEEKALLTPLTQNKNLSPEARSVMCDLILADYRDREPGEDKTAIYQQARQAIYHLGQNGPLPEPFMREMLDVLGPMNEEGEIDHYLSPLSRPEQVLLGHSFARLEHIPPDILEEFFLRTPVLGRVIEDFLKNKNATLPMFRYVALHGEHEDAIWEAIFEHEEASWDPHVLEGVLKNAWTKWVLKAFSRIDESDRVRIWRTYSLVRPEVAVDVLEEGLVSLEGLVGDDLKPLLEAKDREARMKTILLLSKMKEATKNKSIEKEMEDVTLKNEVKAPSREADRSWRRV